MSKKKIAFLFPGQGAQYVGMMKDFYDHFNEAKEVFDLADKLLGFKLSSLIFEGPLEQLTLTKNSQLAIFVSSYAILKVIESHFTDFQPDFTAGLSLGEYTALVASKKISFEECLPIVASRGQFMNDACEVEKGTLNVVLGMSPEEVEEGVSSLRPEHRVWVANLNCPGQVVIAGDLPSITLAQETLKSRGAKRVLPLEVSGAFHSPLMQSAQDRLKPMLQAMKIAKSEILLAMNASGTVVKDENQIRENLIRQVTSPVLWEKEMRELLPEVALYVEIGPGKTLQGMNKRIGVEAPTVSVEKIADLELLKKAKDELYAAT